jgi:hypothetical protein
MFKGLAIMIGGIFVGAVGMEIVRRKYPGALDNLYAKTREMASAAKEAFQAGYEKVTQPEQVAEPTA